jgi:hypothetical protein
MKAELVFTEIMAEMTEENPASPLPDLLGHAFLNAESKGWVKPRRF